MALKVSICIPVYKQVELLKKNLDLIFAQTFSDYELIITDDSPDDAVEKLIQQINSNNITYIHNRPALGAPENWNFAMNLAKGAYIKILHQDDFFATSESLEQFVKLLDNNPKADFCFSATHVNAGGVSNKHQCTTADFNSLKKHPSLLVIKNSIGSPSATIIRAAAFQKFDNNLKWLVDIDWYIRLIEKNSSIVYTTDGLIQSHHGSAEQITASVSTNKEILIKEHVYLLERNKTLLNNTLFAIHLQLLFNKYNIHTLEDIKAIYAFNPSLHGYLERICIQKKSIPFFKMVYYWLHKLTVTDFLYLLKNRFR